MRLLGFTLAALAMGGSACLAACSEQFRIAEGDAGSSVDASSGGAAGTTNTGGASGGGAASGGMNGGAGKSSGGAKNTGGTNASGGSTGAAGADAGSAGDGGGGATHPDGGLLDGGDAGVGGSVYRRTVLDDRPRAYWRMGIKNGTSVPDETGRGNQLVLQGTGHHLGVSGAIKDDDDSAMGFDGAASYATATNPRALDFAGTLGAGTPFTLECWARRSSGGASYFQHLIANVEGVANDRNGYILYLLPEPANQDNARSAFEYDTPGADLGLWGQLGAESVWTHYVAVYDGAQAFLYVDAVLADMTAVASAITERTSPFAVASDGSASFFKGELDEIAVYPRALTQKDIARHSAFRK